MTDFDAIIFDMDGLLVDSETLWADAEIRLLAARGKAYDDNHPRDALIGLRIDEFLHKLCAIFNMDESHETLYDELVGDMLRRIETDIVTKPGAPEIIEYVQVRTIPCAIASSSPASVIEAVVASQGWADALPVRISAESVGRGKPAPDVYLEAARQLGVRPERALALEDSPNGARAAVAAGMTCYAVPDLFHSPVTAFDGITPHVFDSLHTVLAQLTSGQRA